MRKNRVDFLIENTGGLKMEYRHLGKSGIRVSALSLGSWVTFHFQAGIDQAVELMSAAYDAGVNFFDNAEEYANGKSEEVMGAALKKLGWRRSSYLVSLSCSGALTTSTNAPSQSQHQ
jgi:aryl-alcohol dehydrogenase-like predicted oxidoreductase